MHLGESTNGRAINAAAETCMGGETRQKGGGGGGIGISQRGLPGLLPDVADAGAARPPRAPVHVVHPSGCDERVDRRVLSDGDLDGLHLRKLAWHGTAWYGTAWYGTARHGTRNARTTKSFFFEILFRGGGGISDPCEREGTSISKNRRVVVLRGRGGAAVEGRGGGDHSCASERPRGMQVRGMMHGELARSVGRRYVAFRVATQCRPKLARPTEVPVSLELTEQRNNGDSRQATDAKRRVPLFT